MSESTKATIEILEHYHHNGGFYEIPVEFINTVEQELEEQDKEIERLNNIINELEKYGKQRFNEYEAWKEECKNLCYINGITEMLDKLQELKGSGNNERKV